MEHREKRTQHAGGHASVGTAELARIVVVFIALASLAACASVERKFMATKRANIGFFADQTIAMLASTRLDFTRDQAVYVREFLDPAGEEERRVQALMNEMRVRGRNMIRYAIAVVTIAESDKTDKEKVEAYADFAATFRDRVVQNLDMAPESFDGLITECRTKDRLLSALQVIQPIINLSARQSMLLLDELGDALDKLSEKIENKIDERYADIVKYQKALEKEKYHILMSLPLLYHANRGDMEAFRKLVESGVVTRKSLLPEGPPTEDDLQAIGEHLFDRLDILARVESEIKPDWDRYLATHKELDKLSDLFDEQRNKMRLVTLIWVRAHQKMASGIKDPAEWFDVNQAPAKLLNLGIKAVF